MYPMVSLSAAGDWQAVDLAAQVGLGINSPSEGHLCVADADGDGLFDVVLSRHGRVPWPLMRQELDGTFTQVSELGPTTDRHSCTAGDFAGVNANDTIGPPDGRADFYTTTGACEGTCSKAYPNHLYIQRPNGSFKEVAATFGVDDPHGRGREAVTLDANGDGLDDLFLTNEISSLFPLTSNRLFLNTGPGFVEWVHPAVTLSLASSCARALDFNDDGRTDLVVCTPDRTYFLANTVAGFVDVRANLGLSQAYRDVAVADFNGDGHADFVGVQQTKLTVRLWRSTGTPWGAISYTFNLGQGRSVAVGDLFGTGQQRDIYVVEGWLAGNVLQIPDWVLHWNGTTANPMLQAYQVPAPALAKSDNPRDGQGDSVAMVPNWAGTGRDLAIVSNSLWTANGYYQAILMLEGSDGVPNVVGLTQSSASTSIANAGLVVGTVTQQSSTSVPAGSVISQSPTAGTSVANGSAVNLVVSTGPATVSVPNVAGLIQSSASTAIANAGLVVGTVTQQSSTSVPAGSVISQSPTAGTSVANGSAVNLVVSLGPAPVSVPNLVALIQSLASAALTTAGLQVGTVTLQSSPTVAAGVVISQSPTAGTSVANGSTVNLVASTGPAPVSVPNVVGLTLSAASTAITGAALVPGSVTQQSSATVPAGSVISQDPTAGTSVANGSTVNLVASMGPAPVSVPNVVGLTQGAASTAITTTGLVPGTATQQSSATVPAGNVISQEPSAGTSVANSSAVNLVVSTGPATVSVPDVVGLTQSAANTAITSAELVVGTVAQQLSETVPAGDVISQDPLAETTVNAGSAVNLVVSSGPPVSVPDVVGLTQDAAGAAITSAELVVGSVTQQSSATVPAGSVISQDPTAGTSVANGSAVNLVASTGPAPVSVPNVVSLTQAAATTAITNVELVVGTVTQQSSATVPAGSVISQEPSAGTSVANSSAVSLVVSTGPATVSVPDVVGLTQSAASTAITSAELVLGTVAPQLSETVPAGDVISQNPLAETTVNAGSAVNLVVSSGPPVSVPDVVGLSQDAAGAAITSAELVVGSVTQQSSATVPASSVISQDPIAGTPVLNGSAVNLVVSTGPATVSVPNVVGLTQSAASTAITTAELVLGTVEQQSSETVPAGNVIGQNPLAETTVNAGSSVNLAVSTGPATVSVPNVVGLAQSAASAAITTAQLVLGTVAQQSSETVPLGDVMSQNPLAETTVNAGSAVNLVVSSGPPVSVPDVVGLTQDAAGVAITSAELVVGSVTQQSSATVPAGSVISQDPIAGTPVLNGSAVDLVVSTGQAPVSVPDVVSLTQAAATTAITNVELVVGTVTQQSSATTPAGSVISQNPTAGTSVANGSTVDLAVSTGPASASVPNVVGLTQSAASTAITTAELVLGTVAQQSSETVPLGDVMSQNPLAETTVNAGSAVNLVVSSGPAPVSVPNVEGLTQSAASTAITNAALVSGSVTQQSSATVAAGSVISQSPAAGTSVANGSAVNLVVSSGPVSASASATPTSLAFGNRMLNVASPGMSVTIVNTGTTVLPISSISLTGNNPGQFSRSTNCPNQLPVGGTCTATVVFRPTSTGTKSANLTVALGGGATNRTVALSGTGINYSFSVSPTNLAFGNVARGTTSAARTVTITNTSAVALPITSVTLAGTAPGQYTRTNNCPAQVSAGGTCTVSVRFKPTSTGSKSATLIVTPGGGAAAKTVALSGSGT